MTYFIEQIIIALIMQPIKIIYSWKIINLLSKEREEAYESIQMSLVDI